MYEISWIPQFTISTHPRRFLWMHKRTSSKNVYPNILQALSRGLQLKAHHNVANRTDVDNLLSSCAQAMLLVQNSLLLVSSRMFSKIVCPSKQSMGLLRALDVCRRCSNGASKKLPPSCLESKLAETRLERSPASGEGEGSRSRSSVRSFDNILLSLDPKDRDSILHGACCFRVRISPRKTWCCQYSL